MAIPNQVFAGTAVIPNNAPAAAIRNMAECTSKLTRKGEIYIGTGESTTETSQTGDSYTFYKTQSQNIISAINDNLKDSLTGINKANTIKDDTETSGQSSNTYKTIKDILLDSVYPIGSIYISVSDVSPEKFLGGEWEEFAKGKTIVGIDSTNSTNTRFKKAGNTGGLETVKLTKEQIPRHNHYITMSVSTGAIQDTNAFTNIGIKPESGPVNYGLTSDVGSDQAHENMPPYIVVYMWKRTK
jgi:hypothetical protein